MSLSIIEVAPGRWRWLMSSATGQIVASSMLFSSPAECWQTLAFISVAPARLS